MQGEMRAIGLGHIIDTLAGNSTISEDHGSRSQRPVIDSMDVDSHTLASDSKLVSASKYAPKQIIDLDQLVFQQGTVILLA